MPNFRDLLTRAKAEIREVTTDEAAAALEAGALLLDVREADEYEQGAVPGSVFLPRGNLESQIEGRIVDKSTPIVVLCAGGVRSAFAAKTLGDLGYTDVVSMDGGFNRWKDEGRDWRVPEVLTPEQRNQVTRRLGAFRTSMLQDVEAGRPVELDALVAIVGEIGRAIGVATPNIDALYGLARLHARTRGLYPG